MCCYYPIYLLNLQWSEGICAYELFYYFSTKNELSEGKFLSQFSPLFQNLVDIHMHEYLKNKIKIHSELLLTLQPKGRP